MNLLLKSKYYLLYSIIFLGFFNKASAQDLVFTPDANTFIINDSSITTDEVLVVLIRNGYLVRHKDDVVLETEYKSYKGYRMYISLLFNIVNGRMYVQGKLRMNSSPEGDETFQIRNSLAFKEEFRKVYDLIKQIRPRATIETVKF
ncbi:MAG: hypothetical protein ACK5UI_09320 [Bacteroidota bacterium]|jgi:hypothetical protein